MSDFSKNRVIDEWARTKKPSKIGPLFWALIVQVALLTLTVFVVVLVPSRKKEPEFIAHKTIYLPQKELDHKMAQSAFEQVASPPMMMEKLQSTALADHALPSLPTLPESAFNPMVAPDMVMPTSSLFGASGMAGIAGDAIGGSSSLSFFGIKDSGQRVVIAFDVSKSVLNKAEKSGVPITKIKDEAKQLIEGLGINTSFGVVQFIRRYDAFRDRLIAGTEANKERAISWIDSEFHTSGYSPSRWSRKEENGQPMLDGIQAVMETIFEWEPDVIFIISDAGFGRNYPEKLPRIDLDELKRDVNRLQRQLSEKARIHFVGFEVVPDRESDIKSIVRSSGGSYRSF